jgi:hypothetical protein
MTCDECSERSTCTTPCKAVQKILWEDNRVMERVFENTIVCYPVNNEVHFSEITEHQIDDFSNDDVIPWSSGNYRLRQTEVFVERFFNKTPCKEIAERFDVKENTVVCMYSRAVEQLTKIIETLDARKAGIKAVKPERFNDDQKYFLLHAVFGFTQMEIAEMFGRDRDMINKKVKRMSDKFEALFSGKVETDEIPIEDPPIENKISRDQLELLVEFYTEQGLSHRQAFNRIAERQTEKIGRKVNHRAIESKFYKASAQKAIATQAPPP